MTPRIQAMLRTLREGHFKTLRRPEPVDLAAVGKDCDPFMADALRLRAMLEAEEPCLLPGDRIGFIRTCRCVPASSKTGNITPDYPALLRRGLRPLREETAAHLAAADEAQKPFFAAVLHTLDSALAYAARCRTAAEACGAAELADALSRVPHGPAVSFLDACVFVRFIVFTQRCNRIPHLGLGRFDQYMLPYFEHDLQNGIPQEALLELVEEFFISLNYDIDLYPGVQAGDNGQSMMLGGLAPDGTDGFNQLSELCMQASLELNLIDPKINLRVSKKTPVERLEFATRLTRQGLGFPQYCNDDIVIPALTALGYAPADAANYTVAACWEYIIPGKGMDWPNIVTMNFPKVIERACLRHLESCTDFDAFLVRVREEIAEECTSLVAEAAAMQLDVSPYLSAMVEGCLERGRDLSRQGAVYNNYGCHGAGIATAADALAAIRDVVFEKKECTPQQLLDALAADFEGFGPLRNRLLGCPKMGNDDPAADALGDVLMDAFSTCMNGRPNGLGGVFRAGTGSAMEYILSAAQVGATADGRKAGAPYGSSFSPSPECRLAGPLSCIKSFTRFDMTRICNGGPLTMEVHSSTFRNEDGIQKVARLVQAFILRGGHQLQLNAVNRDVLLAALETPEQYRNLIVRVWGWSGYFTELDPPYQQHILHRTEFTV